MWYVNTFSTAQCVHVVRGRLLPNTVVVERCYSDFEILYSLNIVPQSLLRNEFWLVNFEMFTRPGEMLGGGIFCGKKT